MSSATRMGIGVLAIALGVSACGNNEITDSASPVPTATAAAGVTQTSLAIDGAVPPANPESGAATPADLNRAFAQVYQSAGTRDADIRKVLILMPGFLGGAGSFDYMARRIVLRTAGQTVVWAVDRRSNALEDQTGLDAAEAAGDPDIAKNYYFHGAAIGTKTFEGFLAGSAISFASEWGIRTHVEDLDALVSAARQRYPLAAIFLGGHSLGGSIVPIYAAWDFGGRAGFERLSGIVLLEGAPSPDASAAIPRQAAYETTGIGTGGGARSSLKTLRTGSPLASLPFIGPDLFVTSEIIAMRASARFGAPEALSPDADLVKGFFGVLFGLSEIPPMTNRAALGFGFDDNYQPLSFARVSIGEPVGPVGPNPNAGFFGSLVGPDDMLLAPTDLHARYDWQPGADPTDIGTFAEALYAGPSNFIEWYFPARLTLDVAITDGLNVHSTGDWRKDVYGMAVTENTRVDVPVFAVGATRGLVRDVATFDAYRDSLAATLRNGTPRAAAPAGFVEISKSGYVHLDVLTANDAGDGNGIFGPLVDWMDAAVQLAPPPH